MRSLLIIAAAAAVSGEVLVLGDGKMDVVKEKPTLVKFYAPVRCPLLSRLSDASALACQAFPLITGLFSPLPCEKRCGGESERDREGGKEGENSENGSRRKRRRAGEGRERERKRGRTWSGRAWAGQRLTSSRHHTNSELPGFHRVHHNLGMFLSLNSAAAALRAHVHATPKETDERTRCRQGRGC